MSVAQDDVMKQLLATDSSARATAPLQTLLLSIQSGDFEKSSKLLDLVIQLVQEVISAGMLMCAVRLRMSRSKIA